MTFENGFQMDITAKNHVIAEDVLKQCGVINPFNHVPMTKLLKVELISFDDESSRWFNQTISVRNN